VYYGVYTEGGAFPSKKPVDTQESWVSRIDLDCVPPPLSVASLKRSIAKREEVTASSQLFVDKDTMTPLHGDHVLIVDGNWPGSSIDDHIMFKFDTQSSMQSDGSKHDSSNTTWNMFRIDSDYTLILGNGHNSDWDHVYVATCYVGYHGRLEDAEGPFDRSRVRNAVDLSHLKVIELRSVGPIFASSPPNLSFTRLT